MSRYKSGINSYPHFPRWACSELRLLDLLLEIREIFSLASIKVLRTRLASPLYRKNSTESFKSIIEREQQRLRCIFSP